MSEVYEDEYDTDVAEDTDTGIEVSSAEDQMSEVDEVNEEEEDDPKSWEVARSEACHEVLLDPTDDSGD